MSKDAHYHPHIIGAFKSTGMEYNQWAKDFHAWFIKDFIQTHPNIALDFDMQAHMADIDGTQLEVLDVVEFSEVFTLHVLIELYYSTKGLSTDTPPDEPKTKKNLRLMQ
jgi:hypothetical protein